METNRAQVKKQIAKLSAEISDFWSANKTSTLEIDAKTVQLRNLRQSLEKPIVLGSNWCMSDGEWGMVR